LPSLAEVTDLRQLDEHLEALKQALDRLRGEAGRLHDVISLMWLIIQQAGAGQSRRYRRSYPQQGGRLAAGVGLQEQLLQG
jgi:hypothetical protein